MQTWVAEGEYLQPWFTTFNHTNSQWQSLALYSFLITEHMNLMVPTTSMHWSCK